MKSLDLEQATISEIAPHIKARKLSPVELTEFMLERTKRLNPALNAYVTITEELAVEAAKAAQKEIQKGRYRGALHGIPFSIKDNIATRGVRTTAGSKILSEWVPDYDATVVERLKRAGGIFMGKTNMHEWASGGTTINPYYGTTVNPWDTRRIPGGSSGGSAAAVAAGLCLTSIGTDNAGSVRNPASFCGTVGLKATYGRVSRFGDVPGTGGFSTDHFGVFTRTVEGSALVLRSIAGADPKDPLCSCEPVPNYLRGIGKTIKGLRVGVWRGYAEENVSNEVKSAFADALRLLQRLGVKTKDFTIAHASLIPAAQTATSRVENVSMVSDYLRSQPQDFSRSLLHRHITSLMIPGATYVAAQRVRRMICEEFERELEKFDVIVTPTTPLTASTVEECKNGYAEIDGRRVPYQNPTGSIGTILTIPFNLTGLPAITVCCGFSLAGLPVGLQIAGGPFREDTIFEVAHAYEQAAGWYKKRPSLNDAHREIHEGHDV
jgi:aspartyl-tRNA(Asn)/glutamyl-tRNA(Gln) amidotransferase subunit A